MGFEIATVGITSVAMFAFFIAGKGRVTPPTWIWWILFGIAGIDLLGAVLKILETSN